MICHLKCTPTAVARYLESTWYLEVTQGTWKLLNVYKSTMKFYTGKTKEKIDRQAMQQAAIILSAPFKNA